MALQTRSIIKQKLKITFCQWKASLVWADIKHLTCLYLDSTVITINLSEPTYHKKVSYFLKSLQEFTGKYSGIHLYEKILRHKQHDWINHWAKADNNITQANSSYCTSLRWSETGLVWQGPQGSNTCSPEVCSLPTLEHRRALLWPPPPSAEPASGLRGPRGVRTDLHISVRNVLSL